MKLLLLNWRDTSHPRAGGAEVLTETLAQALAARGHDVTLLCPAFPGSQPMERRHGYTLRRRGNQLTVRLWAALLWYRSFHQHADALCVDQMHGVPFGVTLYAADRCVLFINEVAGSCWRRIAPFPISSIGRWMEQISLFLNRKRQFVTISESTKNELGACGIPPARIAVIPMWVPTKQHVTSPTSHREPILISLSRLAPMKRVEDIIAAAVLLRKEIPALKLWIVGTGFGRYARSIKRLTKAHADFITMHGRVDERTKSELLRQARVLVATSCKEGYGLHIIEAAQSGTPAVAYDVPGIRDAVVNGTTGVLTTTNTPTALAHQLKTVLTDDSMHQRLAEAAWSASTTLSVEDTVDAFEACLVNHSGTIASHA